MSMKYVVISCGLACPVASHIPRPLEGCRSGCEVSPGLFETPHQLLYRRWVSIVTADAAGAVLHSLHELDIFTVTTSR